MMMLRKRSRPAHKDQSRGHLMLDSASDSSLSSDSASVQKTRSTSFFSVPGLFVGFNTNGVSDSDSARSPTSPLDYKVFSNLGNPFVRSPRSPGIEGPRKSWDCDRVGLGLVDSLNDDSNPPGKVLGVFSDSRNILFGSQMRINIPSTKTCLDRISNYTPGSSPKSLPQNYVISSEITTGIPSIQLGSSQPMPGSSGVQLETREMGKIRSCSADIGRTSLPVNGFIYLNPKSNSEEFRMKRSQLGSPSIDRDVNIGNLPGSLPVSLGSCHGFMGSLSASDIELSEDYTRIITHGPNPKTTHIFGDCIVESHSSELPDFTNKKGEEEKGSSWMVKHSEDALPSPVDDFLSFCYSCKKKLEEGKDIYMYRGEKAFCSSNCRAEEILIDEEMEKPVIDSSGSPRSTYDDEEIFLTGMVVIR